MTENFTHAEIIDEAKVILRETSNDMPLVGKELELLQKVWPDLLAEIKDAFTKLDEFRNQPVNHSRNQSADHPTEFALKDSADDAARMTADMLKAQKNAAPHGVELDLPLELATRSMATLQDAKQPSMIGWAGFGALAAGIGTTIGLLLSQGSALGAGLGATIGAVSVAAPVLLLDTVYKKMKTEDGQETLGERDKRSVKALEILKEHVQFEQLQQPAVTAPVPNAMEEQLHKQIRRAVILEQVTKPAVEEASDLGPSVTESDELTPTQRKRFAELAAEVGTTVSTAVSPEISPEVTIAGVSGHPKMRVKEDRGDSWVEATQTPAAEKPTTRRL